MKDLDSAGASVRGLSIILLLWATACSDKPKDAPNDRAAERASIIQTVPSEDPAEGYQMPEEFSQWLEANRDLDASTCTEPTQPGLDDFSVCVVENAAKRCKYADWCFIDCINKGMGRFAGGGCWHLCYGRGSIGEPEDQDTACSDKSSAPSDIE